MATALVTGGTGFVGANVVRRLLRDGHDVHLLVRPGHQRWRLADVADAVRWHEVALEDAESVASAFPAIGPQWVLHLAAHGAYSTQTDVRRMVASNVLGTVNLVEAAVRNGFEGFVHTGSSSEYGFKDHPPAEDEHLEPNSDYAVTKASATLYCRHIATARQVPITTLRLYSVFGPWEEPTRLMPSVVLAALDKRLPPLVDPSVARDFVYVDDAVDAILVAVRTPSPGAVYNVGRGTQTTLAELVDIVREHFAVEAAPAWGTYPKRTWDTATWQADPSRIKAELGWAPRHDVATGLAAFAGWLTSDSEVLRFYREHASV